MKGGVIGWTEGFLDLNWEVVKSNYIIKAVDPAEANISMYSETIEVYLWSISITLSQISIIINNVTN